MLTSATVELAITVDLTRTVGLGTDCHSDALCVHWLATAVVLASVKEAVVSGTCLSHRPNGHLSWKVVVVTGEFMYRST